MELSTPNKNRIPLSPLSRFENSPVFDYINSLSPLELVKPVRCSDPASLNSLSLSSPASAFAFSPVPASLKEAGVPSVIRCQFEDSLKAEVTGGSSGCVKGFGDESLEEAIKLSSPKDDVNGTPVGQFELAVAGPKGLSDGCDGDAGSVLVDEREEKKIADNLGGRSYLCESEKGLRGICRFKQNEDQAQGDWVALISHVTDVMSSDPAILNKPSAELKEADAGMASFVSDVLQITQDSDPSSLADMHADFQSWVPTESEVKSNEVGEQMEQKQTSDTISQTQVDELVVNDETTQTDVKGRKPWKKKVMRRCLVFEMAGVQRKRSLSQTNPILSRMDNEPTQAEDNYLARSGNAHQISSRRGIGLHLNALATTSSDGKDTETLAFGSSENKDQIMENAAMSSMDTQEDLGFHSPKRPKMDNEVACKRCNCRRSKCLKLYCECFAAGLYCIEPCSCRDCFNKPAHEDTVLETRKQIESRDPLAFAPKVMRSMDSLAEPGEETHSTPASARHKRGCKCRKSGCLKKYCECFQEGVGCSPNCRCAGCKNSFGSNNGVQQVYEDLSTDNKCKSEKTLHCKEERVLIPPETTRPPFQLAKTSEGQLSGSPLSALGPLQVRSTNKLRKPDISAFRQPKFEMNLEAIPENECPDNQTSTKTPGTGMKSSPNCKRIAPPHLGFGSSLTWTRKSSRKFIMRPVQPFRPLYLPTEP